MKKTQNRPLSNLNTGALRCAQCCRQKGYISPIWGEAPTEAIYIKNCVVGDVFDVVTCAKFQNEIFRVTTLQGVEFSIFLLIFERALQQCSATTLHVISNIDCTPENRAISLLSQRNTEVLRQTNVTQQVWFTFELFASDILASIDGRCVDTYTQQHCTVTCYQCVV